MADIKLSTIAGGGGGIFRAEAFVHDQTIASGQTGTLVVIGTAGKITHLTTLATTSVSAQSGISIDVDGDVIIGPETLSDVTPSNDTGFYVSNNFSAGSVKIGNAAMTSVFGEFITITKDGGNTTEELGYSFVTGSIK